MIDFQTERIADCWDGFYALCKEHHESLRQDVREVFSMDRDRYVHYQNAGMLHVITARDRETGRMVGLFGVYIIQSMHTRTMVAREDLLYLTPSHRVGRNAVRFMHYCEDYVRQFAAPEAPVKAVLSVDRENASGIKGLLQLLDYEPATMIWSKYLYPRADSASPLAEGAPHEAVSV